jgi:hypothetical protein
VVPIRPCWRVNVCEELWVLSEETVVSGSGNSSRCSRGRECCCVEVGVGVSSRLRITIRGKSLSASGLKLAIEWKRQYQSERRIQSFSAQSHVELTELVLVSSPRVRPMVVSPIGSNHFSPRPMPRHMRLPLTEQNEDM